MTDDGRESVIGRLEKSFSSYYDVERIDDGTELRMVASFHSRGESYLLTRSVNLWSVEDHEYVYVFSVGVLDEETFDRCMASSLRDGTDRIHTSTEHRSSTITSIFICDSISHLITKKIKRHTYHRNFKMTLHGWMDHRVAAFGSDTGLIVTDRLGRDLAEIISRSVGNSDNR